MRIWLVSMLLVSACGASCEASGVELSMLTQGKKVIPLTLEYESLTVTDIRLPDLVLANKSDQPVTPVDIEVIGSSAGEEIGRTRLIPAVTKALIEKVGAQLKALPAAELADDLAVVCGKMNLDASHLTGAVPIKPGDCAVVLLSKVMYFHHVGPTGVDALRIVMKCESGGKTESIEMPVPLTIWNAQTKYHFPLKGSIAVANMPLNYMHHRQGLSQEFGMDMLEVHPDKNGEMSTTRVAKPGKFADYYIYGRDIHSAADGTVIEVANGFPESEAVNSPDWSDEAFAKVAEGLKGKIGKLNILAGNYVVIQHAKDEFGFYAHLKQDSIKVKVGQKVKSGQVIACAGSTGNSTEPHLHFQLQDSRDFYTANGLPIMFEEVPAAQMVQYLTKANSLACSDYTLVVTKGR